MPPSQILWGCASLAQCCAISARAHEEALPAEACSAGAGAPPKPLTEETGAPAQAPSRVQPGTVSAAAVPIAGAPAPAPQRAIAVPVPVVRLHVLARAPLHLLLFQCARQVVLAYLCHSNCCHKYKLPHYDFASAFHVCKNGNCCASRRFKCLEASCKGLHIGLHIQYSRWTVHAVISLFWQSLCCSAGCGFSRRTEKDPLMRTTCSLRTSTRL